MPHALRCLIAATAVALGGCGDDDSATKPRAAPSPSATATPTATTTAESAPSHEEFVDALNRTCSEGQQRIDAAQKEFETALEADQSREASDALAQVISAAEPYWEQQGNLDAPPDEEEAFEAYLTAQRRFQGLMRRLEKALSEEDLDRYEFLAQAIQDARSERRKVALDLGLEDCGK